MIFELLIQGPEGKSVLTLRPGDTGKLRDGTEVSATEAGVEVRSLDRPAGVLLHQGEVLRLGQVTITVASDQDGDVDLEATLPSGGRGGRG